MSDLIERQAVLKICRRYWHPTFNPIMEEVEKLPSAQSEILACGSGELVQESDGLVQDLVKDCISRKMAIDSINRISRTDNWKTAMIWALTSLPSAQPEEVVPHKNYKYLSDYWCECGWHLGKKGDVKYCSDCGRKVKWNG